MAEPDDLIRLTAEIVSAHAEANSVDTKELPALIRTVHEALAGLGQEDAPVAEAPSATKPIGAVSVRKSLAREDKILSMIDGKPYSTLKKHIARHGFTPESYRAHFGLKPDYPMVAAAYSEMRKNMAKMIGLGSKVVGVAAAGVAAVALAEVLIPASPKEDKPPRMPRKGKAGAAATQSPMALVETARETQTPAEISNAGAAPATEAQPAPKRRSKASKAVAEGSAPSPAQKRPRAARPVLEDEFFDAAKNPLPKLGVD